jgi:hypothetical protein
MLRKLIPLFALALAAASCKKDRDEVSASNAKKQPTQGPEKPGKRKSPHEVAVEQVLALDAVVKKYTKLVSDAEAAGDFEKATELRTRLQVAQGAYEDARERLEMMDRVSPMLQEKERQEQRQGDAAPAPQ